MSEYIVKIEEPISPLFYERQLEEILRCKDCCLQDEFKYCERLGFKVGDYGYCAWGDRK